LLEHLELEDAPKAEVLDHALDAAQEGARRLDRLAERG
jgi:hypothetical protein